MKHILFAMILALTATAHAQVIKNEQSILGGTLTRAGNTMQSQLTDPELQQLCNQGYTSAYFLYAGARPRTIHCSQGNISYSSQSINNMTPILEDIYRDIKSGEGRTFVHCNNGAHASGLVAAVSLIQFCGYSPEQAFNYWNSHLSGYVLQASNLAGIRRRLNYFQPVAGLNLTAAERSSVCR